MSFLLGNLVELSLSCLPLSSAHLRGLPCPLSLLDEIGLDSISGGSRDVAPCLISVSHLDPSLAALAGLFAICASRLLAHVRQAQHLRIEAGHVGDEMEVEEEEVADDMQVETERTQVAVETAAGLAWVTETKIRVTSSSKTSHLPPALLSVRQHVQALCNPEYVDKLLDVVQAVSLSLFLSLYLSLSVSVPVSVLFLPRSVSRGPSK